MTSFADRLLSFLTGFPLPAALPAGVSAESPYQQPAVQPLLTAFARQYYASPAPRIALLGINPGRFGSGRTGVAFTDPVALADNCGIANPLPRQRELSSQFIYQVVAAMGGPARFYQDFYLGSLYPLVLLREERNYNYYDAPALTAALADDLRLSLHQQVHEVGLRRTVVVCLGRRNAKYLQQLNQELRLFEHIEVLDHPRYLMQYKRRELPQHVARYVEVLSALIQ
ncbi:hypothetical protein PK28_10765 [Hymenobacter sp. DG25B]|nr:hypothetical protein PK28_10765 [Hymenobacter sp. DG25B]